MPNESLIEEAFKAIEGHHLIFSQVTTEYIRKQLTYQAVGRKILMVDELPQSSYAPYVSSELSITRDPYEGYDILEEF